MTRHVLIRGTLSGQTLFKASLPLLPRDEDKPSEAWFCNRCGQVFAWVSIFPSGSCHPTTYYATPGVCHHCAAHGCGSFLPGSIMPHWPGHETGPAPGWWPKELYQYELNLLLRLL